jgi:ParB-like chromosome segregation protein Spo0J
MSDPFNPETGAFRKNIRESITGLDDTELRQSLKQFGWRKEFPAIADENDVVLVGHRRMRLAKQLGIEPVIQKIKLGKGDEADTERLKIAIVSNIGGQPLTRDDRKRLAEHLYGQKEWTMEKIAEALNTTPMTVSRDLEGFNTVLKPSRPKGGRPKGTGQSKKKRAPTSERAPQTHRAREIVRPLVEAGETVNARELGVKHGISHVIVETAVEAEIAALEAREEPIIDRADLSMTAQQKLDSAIKQEKARLAVDFNRRVNDEIKKRLDEIFLPDIKKQIADAEKLYTRRKGMMTKDIFNAIRRALHPDSRNSISEQKLGEAFDAFMALEKNLLDEKDSPTSWPDIPDNVEAWDRMRTRPAKRKAAANGVQRR